MAPGPSWIVLLGLPLTATVLVDRPQSANALLCVPMATPPLPRMAGGLPPAPSRSLVKRRVGTAVAVESEPVVEAVDFPAPLTEAEKLARAGVFWWKVLPMVWGYGKLLVELGARDVTGLRLSEEECELRWNEEHELGAVVLSNAFNDMMGFYAKTGQIIASRHDLFPPQYTERLGGLTDQIDPMPASLVRAVVQQELCNETRFSEMFAEFDDEPLGSATVAQVHRARLTAAFGGREVAIKVQRPSIEPKLLGDVANLKNMAKQVRGVESIPVDYYVVFSELEAQLGDEFDFVNEANAMNRIADTMKRFYVPVTIPRAVEGLVADRVLAMDFLSGVPLSRALDAMKARGLDPKGPEAQLFGRKLLKTLTDAFGVSILLDGLFHADPHPGNIFVMDTGEIGLIDFGQVKTVDANARLTLAKIMIALADRESDTNPADLQKIGSLALDLGVTFSETCPEVAPAAIAMWLFDGSVTTLPGGYDSNELSPDSPLKDLASFPQELVLVGRNTILIKGIAARLGIEWSLAKEWRPIAQELLDSLERGEATVAAPAPPSRRSRVKKFLTKRGAALVQRLPSRLSTRAAAMVLKLQKWRERRKTAKEERPRRTE